MEESALSYHERFQKYLHDITEKYIHTDFPLYTAIVFYHFNSFWKRLPTKEPPSLVALVFEETKGIHMIEVFGALNSANYIRFIPLEDIKKVYVLFPSYFITTSIIIKTYSRKNYTFNIMKYLKIRHPDRFGNSGYREFIKKLQEYAKSLT